MANPIDGLMDQYDRGTLTRRQLVKGLLLLAVPVQRASAAEQARPAAALDPAQSINHVHMGVSDHEKSAQFYSALFGAKIRDKGTPAYVENLWIMTLPGQKPGMGSWLSLDNKHKPGTYDHMGIGIDVRDIPTAERLAADINKRFPFAKARAGGYADPKGPNPVRISISLSDPDGLNIQLIGTNDDGWLPKAKPAER